MTKKPLKLKIEELEANCYVWENKLKTDLSDTDKDRYEARLKRDKDKLKELYEVRTRVVARNQLKAQERKQGVVTQRIADFRVPEHKPKPKKQKKQYRNAYLEDKQSASQ